MKCFNDCQKWSNLESFTLVVCRNLDCSAFVASDSPFRFLPLLDRSECAASDDPFHFFYFARLFCMCCFWQYISLFVSIGAGSLCNCCFWKSSSLVICAGSLCIFYFWRSSSLIVCARSCADPRHLLFVLDRVPILLLVVLVVSLRRWASCKFAISLGSRTSHALFFISLEVWGKVMRWSTWQNKIFHNVMTLT